MLALPGYARRKSHEFISAESLCVLRLLCVLHVADSAFCTWEHRGVVGKVDQIIRCIDGAASLERGDIYRQRPE